MNFERLVDTYEKPIFNLVNRLVGDFDEAADLTQEVFLSAYQSMSTFRRESSEFTWLYRIAVNKCRTAFRKRERSLDSGASSIEEEVVDESAAGLRHAEGSPDASLERKELKARIELAITSLPYDFRAVVVLRDVQGLSYKDMSEVLGISLDLVRVRLSRARGLLRQKLGPYLQAQR